MRSTIDEWEDANVNIGSVSDNAKDIVKKRTGVSEMIRRTSFTMEGV